MVSSVARIEQAPGDAVAAVSCGGCLHGIPYNSPFVTWRTASSLQRRTGGFTACFSFTGTQGLSGRQRFLVEPRQPCPNGSMRAGMPRNGVYLPQLPGSGPASPRQMPCVAHRICSTGTVVLDSASDCSGEGAFRSVIKVRPRASGPVSKRSRRGRSLDLPEQSNAEVNDLTFWRATANLRAA